MCTDTKNIRVRKGGTLAHAKAHTQDHATWSRRNFLRNMGLLGGMSLFGNPLQALGASPLSTALSNSDNERILVLIRLKGGNDGLNTFIPLYQYDAYANYRPTLHIPETKYIKLNDEIAIPNAFSEVRPLWEQGAMRIVHAAGYERPDFSHFRSSDIWSAANEMDKTEPSGWVGRYLGQRYPDYASNLPEVPAAIQIGSVSTNMFTSLGGKKLSISVSNPEELEDIARLGQLHDLADLPDCILGQQLGHVRSVANSVSTYAERIASASRAGNNAIRYESNNRLAAQLRTVARLIKGNLGTKIYSVELGGFDTHAKQSERHPILLQLLGEAINQFYTDLAADGWADKVLSVTYSEFGRRVEQNASDGTDHGAAAPMMLFGPALQGNSFVGERPDLNDLDAGGNLKHSTDFRQVYATLLEKWLCVDATLVDEVLGQSFERLDLGFDCQGIGERSATVHPANVPSSIQHYLMDDGFGGKRLHYTLPQQEDVRIDLISVLGRHISTLQSSVQQAGEHQLNFNPAQYGVRQGQYFYQIQTRQERVSGGVQFF